MVNIYPKIHFWTIFCLNLKVEMFSSQDSNQDEDFWPPGSLGQCGPSPHGPSRPQGLCGPCQRPSVDRKKAWPALPSIYTICETVSNSHSKFYQTNF